MLAWIITTCIGKDSEENDIKRYKGYSIYSFYISGGHAEWRTMLLGPGVLLKRGTENGTEWKTE